MFLIPNTCVTTLHICSWYSLREYRVERQDIGYVVNDTAYDLAEPLEYRGRHGLVDFLPVFVEKIIHLISCNRKKYTLQIFFFQCFTVHFSIQ